MWVYYVCGMWYYVCGCKCICVHTCAYRVDAFSGALMVRADSLPATPPSKRWCTRPSPTCTHAFFYTLPTPFWLEQVLQQLGYLEADRTVALKGRVACEVGFCD